MSPATDPGRAAEGMQEVRYLRAVIDTLRQELVTERKLVKGFEADLIAARKERDEATRLLRVLNEETVLAGYPCGDRDRTLANLRALRSDLIALAKMYGEACRDLVYARSGEDDLFWQKEEAVVALSRKLVAAEAEAAQLRARLHEAEKGREGSGRDPGGSGHPAEPEPASGLGPSDGCPSRDQAEADPPRRFREVLPEAYGWLVDADGYLWGLTAGDMGYDQTDMRLIDLFDLAVEAEWHRFNITGEKKWSVHTITLDFITTLAAALGIEARRAETLGSACESPAPTGAMPDPLTPAPEANQEAGDGR